jgi:hypothetical protein
MNWHREVRGAPPLVALLRAIACGALLAFPQAAPGQSALPPGTARIPDMVVVQPESIAFGAVPPGSSHTGSFTLLNTTPAPVTVRAAVPSCKCTALTDIVGKSIPAGGSLKFDVTMEVPLTPGVKDATVQIVVEGLPRPLTAKLSAESVMPIRVEPAYVDALKGKSMGTVVARSADGSPFRVLSAGGSAPQFVGFDPGVDAPRGEYTLRWTAPSQPCEAMPLWWVIETDRQDCPLVPLRIRHECTGSKADPGRFAREWFFPEPIGIVGRVAPGSAAETVVPIEHYNPQARGAVQRPQWKDVVRVETRDPRAQAALVRTQAGARDQVDVRLSVTPAPTLRGFFAIPVDIVTATGTGTITVYGIADPAVPASASAAAATPASASPAGPVTTPAATP